MQHAVMSRTKPHKRHLRGQRGLAQITLMGVLVAVGVSGSAREAQAESPAGADTLIETGGVQDELESEALRDQLGALAVTLADSHEGAVVQAAVRDVTYGYEISVVVRLNGVESSEELRCTPCGVGEVVTRVDEHLRAKLSDMDEASEEQAETSPASSMPRTEDEQALSRAARRRFLVGAGTVGVGVIGVAVGVALAVRGDKPVDGGAAGVERSTTRPIGYATLGIGLGLAAVGATLMAIYRPRPRSGDQARLWLFPSTFSVSAPSAGLGAVARF